MTAKNKKNSSGIGVRVRAVTVGRTEPKQQLKDEACYLRFDITVEEFARLQAIVLKAAHEHLGVNRKGVIQFHLNTYGGPARRGHLGIVRTGASKREAQS